MRDYRPTILIVDDCAGYDRQALAEMLEIIGYETTAPDNVFYIHAPAPALNPSILGKQHGAYRQFEKRDKRKNFRR